MKNKIKNRISQYKLRQKALERANYQCERCGETHNLHMHHIRYPGTSLDDVVILCSYCHYLTHYGHPPNTKKITKEKVEALCKEGKSLREMANIFQTSYETIRQKLIRWKLKTIKKSKAHKKLQRAVSMDIEVWKAIKKLAGRKNVSMARIIEEKLKKDEEIRKAMNEQQKKR